MKLPNIFETEVVPLALFAGDVIYSDGDEPTAMYIVQSGEVELRVGGRCIETVGPDENTFGLSEYFDGEE
jgi:CRP-like cAMP-binding protein